MASENSYQISLFKIAALTSLGWGIISVFPMVSFDNIRQIPLKSQTIVTEFPQVAVLKSPLLAQAPGKLPLKPVLLPPPQPNYIFSIACITVFMLCLWLMNIYLYSWLQTTSFTKKFRTVIRYALSYIGAIIIYQATLLSVGFVLERGWPMMWPMLFPLIVAITNNTIILVLIDFIYLQKTKAQIEVENTQLKMNHVIAQHQHLKDQLHPHFLFNSLNTLKSLIKRRPQEAENYLIRLADLLRAAISGDRQDSIPLKEELKLCIDYLEMQKVRFKDAFFYKTDIPEPILLTGSLPLFSLQLLVENAIKHNAFTVEEPLHIFISYNKNNRISVWNNKKPKPQYENSPGIGLKNLSERYKVIAGQDINILETNSSFCVELLALSS